MLVVLILPGSDLARYTAAGLFVLAAATDGLDGYLARRYSGATALGQWLDPLADKILVTAPVVAMAITDRFPAWAVVVIVLREFAVSALRAWLGSRGVAMPASPWGKAKTAVQMVLVPLYLAPLGQGAEPWRLATLWLAVVLTVWSGFDYFWKAARR